MTIEAERLAALQILYRDGDKERALELLEPILSSSYTGTQTQALYYYGMVWGYAGEYDRAISAFQRAQANYRDAKNLAGVEMTSIMIADMFHKQDAHGNLEKTDFILYSITGQYSDLHRVRAELRVSQGRYLEAIESTKLLADMNKGQLVKAECLSIEAFCHYMLGDIETGRRLTRRAESIYLELEFEIGLNHNRINDYYDSIILGTPDTTLKNYLIKWSRDRDVPSLQKKIEKVERLANNYLN